MEKETFKGRRAMRAGFFPGVYRIVDEVLERHRLIPNGRLADEIQSELAATVGAIGGELVLQALAGRFAVKVQETAA
jgi:hypothetical protein